MSTAEDTPYHAKAPIKEGLQAGAIGAGVGLLVSAVQNSVGTHSHGATGVFARTGGTIGVFGNNLAHFTSPFRNHRAAPFSQLRLALWMDLAWVSGTHFKDWST